MRRGTTTMKMINSTSTTSTSGVMLISDCRLKPESSLLNCMMSFSLRTCALRDQSHAAETGLFDCNHGLLDLTEVEPCIAPDHDPGVRFSARRSAEGLAELLGCDLLVIDPQFAGVVDGDQNAAPLVALIARLHRVWQVDVRSLPHLWRHHHEDDQQHEHDVDERRNVDGRLHPGRLTEPHEPPPARWKP